MDRQTGKTLWQQVCVEATPHQETHNTNSHASASPVVAGGKVYLTDRSGTFVVIEDSETQKIVATNSMEETVDATLAIVDNELFIRGDKHLFCIAMPAN